MKRTHLWYLVSAALTVAGALIADAYTVLVPPNGSALIANQLDNGGNTLDEVLPGMPNGSALYKWDCALQAWSPSYTYDDTLGMWFPVGGTLSPGEGAMFFNNASVPVTLTFVGTPHVPVLPYLPCGCGVMQLLSRQTNDVGTFENITGGSPPEGAQVMRWNVAAQTYEPYNFSGGAWHPSVPVANVGESVLINSPCVTNNYKWNQPPVTGGGPTNVFYGWNQISTEEYGPQAADDWVCTTTNPVNKVRWWGSFANWQGTNLPAPLNGFWVIFFNDVPAGFDLPWSHPGGIQPPLARFYTNFTWRYAGRDYDPRSGTYESCFVFEQVLQKEPFDWWFYQSNEPTGTNIYWLSIIANQSPVTDHFFGWKTRPRSPDSPAPDAAVTFDINDPAFSSMPIWWPEPTNQWDLAFELITTSAGGEAKWEQLPDLTYTGMDVRATTNWNSTMLGHLLADDFLCTSQTYITNITIWGSLSNDFTPMVLTNITFTLSIHDDIPPGFPPHFMPWSMPGAVKWLRTFTNGQYTCSILASNLQEGWFAPPTFYLPNGDTICYQYDFHIPWNQAFWQEGTPTQPRTYWLDLQARVPGPVPQFGWKTSINHWQDDAVWAQGGEPYDVSLGMLPPWNELRHPQTGESLDLAFRLNGMGEMTEEIKWSQPPVLYTLTNGYNGWNQYSVYGGTNIVADDWVCTNATPVTDIHWWGSFIGWTDTTLPGIVPYGFVISIWSDVPKGPGVPFSHPGVCLTNIYTTTFAPTFVGWDYDPRNPNAAPDACFKFDQDLTRDQWFRQAPGTNTYWISIAAQYPAGMTPDYPWGWKTRPRDTHSLAPDDAVRIFTPTAPLPGISYQMGTNIWWPTITNSWDMAFSLTTTTGCPPPTIICSNLTVECGKAWSPPFAWDNCCNVALVPTQTGSQTNGSCPWLITETWKATDCQGQTNTCTRVVTVQDTTPPVITCANDKTVQCGLAWSFDLPNASDTCCGTNVTVTVSSTRTNGACPWVISRVWKAVDCCNNFNLCTQIVTVVDTLPPTLTCLPNKTVAAGWPWNFDPPSASDTCCGTNITINVIGTVTNSPCPLTVTRTWNAVDCCTNVAQPCSQTVTVVSTNLPPADTNSVKFVQWPKTIGGYDVYDRTIIFLADDFRCTNTGYISDIHIWCSYLNDQVANPPMWLGIYSDVPVSATNTYSHPGQLLWQQTFTPDHYQSYFWDCGAEQWWDPTSHAFYGPDSQVVYSVFYPTNAFLQQGTSQNPTNYWLAVYCLDQSFFGWKTSTNAYQDAAVWGAWTGNPGGATTWTSMTDPNFGGPLNMAFKITTSTNQCPPPSINCTNLTVECGSSWPPPYAWDNCCNAALTPILAWSQTNGTCPWVITETWKATDCKGQSNTCTRLVTVQDTTPPSITCVGDKTVQCGSAWSFDPPTASDICCGTNVTVSIVGTVTNGSCPWLITRTWKATDCCTNSKTCSQRVTVVDNTPPTLICAPNKTVVAGWPWSFDPPFVSDACCGTNITINILSTVTNLPCPLTVTRTWNAVDCCTNVTQPCSQTVTMVNTNLPPADSNTVKFVQWPKTVGGYDVYDRTVIFLADDFLCTNTGPITDIHLWCSYLYDEVASPPMWLGIWSDVPAGPTSNFSHPGQLLWQQVFAPDQYQRYFWDCGAEQFYMPAPGGFYGTDSQVYYYVFYPTNTFVQQGSPQHPTNYWLSVYCMDASWFGWKTSTNAYNDAATWAGWPPNGANDWTPMSDPNFGGPLNMAFKITTSTNPPPPSGVKFTQPPDLSTNGFDVRILRPKILADDFLCTKTGFITNIHIWASWLEDYADPTAVFQLGFWTDVPITAGLGPNLLTNGTFEPAFTNAGVSGTWDGMADWVPPGWQRQETFSGNGLEDSYIGPAPDNGPSAPGRQAARFWRSKGGDSGDWTAIYQDLSLNPTLYAHLYLTMDVTVWSHNLPAGGWQNPAFEWPALVEVDYVDTTGHNQVWRHGWYLDPPGDDGRSPINDPGQGLIPFYNDTLVQPGVWVPNSFDLLSELPQVQTITRILVGGSGWDFSSEVDNVSIRASTTNAFSHPGNLVWTSLFAPGQYRSSVAGTESQPYYDPNLGPNGILGYDTNVWQYDFPVLTNAAFWQTNGHIYWLSVSAQDQSYVGWKTAVTHWNDDAVYGHVDNEWNPLSNWQELFDPFHTRSLDLAFSLTTVGMKVTPPVITNIWVTNLVTEAGSRQVVGLEWTCQNGVQYQVLSAPDLGCRSDGADIRWVLCGPDLAWPTHWYCETNALPLQRFYRVRAIDP